MTRRRLGRRITGRRILWLLVMGCAQQETTSCPTEPLYCDDASCYEGHVALEIHPATGTDASRLLVGDTLRMHTRSDSGFAVPVTWTVSGAGAVIVPGTEPPVGGIASWSSVLIKGVQPGGTPTLVANHVASNHYAQSTLRVADSSVIRRLTISPGSTPVSVGELQGFYATLRDSAGVIYRGQPEQWFSSDTIVATIEKYVAGRPIVRGKKTGTAVITATFLSVQGAVTVTVVQ